MSGLESVMAEWTGRSRTLTVTLDPFPANALAAALDLDRRFAAGERLPLTWHWLYGHEPVAGRDTGADGHPRLGLVMPPVPLARRMWAGGRMRLERPLLIGAILRKRITVRSITEKQGQSGRLVFVLVEETFEDDDGVLLVEERDIVYREARPLVALRSPAPPFAYALRRSLTPDPVLLFRYSALTWNGHRIHYDHPYATGVEGYPGLVVHGPLLATFMSLLCEELAGRGRLRRFAFRARSPLFVDRPLVVEAGWDRAASDRRLHARVLGDDGRLAMEGEGEAA
jgi:3-methylfumaryl-CoA hydratase